MIGHQRFRQCATVGAIIATAACGEGRALPPEASRAVLSTARAAAGGEDRFSRLASLELRGRLEATWAPGNAGARYVKLAARRAVTAS